jgi:hypothetical protein
MTTYITPDRAHQHKNIDLHGYILSGKRELIAQNQALERADKGKFSLKDAASVQGRFWRLARKRGFGSPVRIHIDGNLRAKVSLCLSREASVLQEDWLPSG